MHKFATGGCFILAKKGAKQVAIAQDINPFSLLEEFIIMRKAQGISNYTATSYRSALRNFFAEYKGSIKDSKKLKQAVYLYLSDKSSGYYNKLLQALRQYFEYCIGEGILTENPCNMLKYKRSGARIIQHDDNTIKVFLSIPEKGTYSGLRDYTLILTMLDTGIRPNEIVQIKIEDIDFMNSQIIVKEQYSKTRQLRTLPISVQTVNGIKKLINARHPEWSPDVPVFCSFSGNNISTHNLQEKFREYSEQLGTTITPYHLRHTFALWFVRNGGNVFALQKMMGHTKLDMTQNYVSLATADVKNSHTFASPLKNIFSASKRVGSIIKHT